MNIGVIGGSGYAGGELLRLLSLHPLFDVKAVSAHSQAGELIISVHPQLQNYGQTRFVKNEDVDFKNLDLVFLALPHGESAAIVEKIPSSVKIIDLGADFRLSDKSAWEKYYGGAYAGTWVYGLPELSPSQKESISNQTRVANPGCYATSISLGLAPAIGFIDSTDIVVVAASGTTGAGRNAKINLIASEVMGSLTSYKFGGVHQHTPEIEQAITSLGKERAKISFTPILAPMPRGILATITAKLTKQISVEKLHQAFTTYYELAPFVSVLPLGQLPKTSAVTGTNKAMMQIAIDENTNRMVVSVAIDNLGKGAAGQAIQNANIVVGIDETTGLLHDGIGA
jgi:N-acetyl-gamma-glutamyl-phosphate reductase